MEVAWGPVLHVKMDRIPLEILLQVGGKNGFSHLTANVCNPTSGSGWDTGKILISRRVENIPLSFRE